jgi:hypothetical protein
VIVCEPTDRSVAENVPTPLTSDDVPGKVANVSEELNETMPLKEVSTVFAPLRAVTVRLNAVPTTTFVGAETTKCGQASPTGS